MTLNLQQLRTQAKELARAARVGDPEARRRLGDRPPKLSSAQRAIAREHGFRDWPALVHHAEATVASFVLAATSERCDRARRLLQARPEIARDRWAALVLGRGWDGDPNAAGGPRDWPPLMYVCHSCFGDASAAAALLDAGADPNRPARNEQWEISALYGAVGVRRDPELCALLLARGADPNGEPEFGDALYHAVESDDPACLTLLLEYHARAEGSNALAHALDYERPEHVALLIEAGEPVEARHLVHAVRRGRDAATIRLLARHGADLDGRGGEWSTPPEQHRTAYQNAVIRGRDDVAAELASLGANPELRPGDRAVVALAAGQRRPAEPLPASLDADQQEVLVEAALREEALEPIVAALGVDRVLHYGGGPPGTVLHHASWTGNASVVARLLALGADPRASSGAQFDSPVAWAMLGSQDHGLPGRDYVAVAQALLDRGAELEPRFEDVAQGPVADWLAEREV